MNSLDISWVKNDSESFSFNDVFELSRHLPNPTEQFKRIYFYSNCELSDLKKVLACWLIGYAIVPISPKQHSEQTNRLLSLTKAISIQDIQRTEKPFIRDFPFEFDSLTESCVIQTSGSTSLPKVVPLLHQQIYQAYLNNADWFNLTSDDTWLLNLPLHHIGGLSILLRAWYSKSSVFVQDDSKLSTTKSLLELGLITYCSLVPTQLKRLLDLDLKPSLTFKKILLGGGFCSEKIMNQAIEQGLTIVYGFGMTETAAQIIGQEFREFPTEICIGKPKGDVQFKITIDDLGNEQATEGLLWLKSKQIAHKYLSPDTFPQIDDWFCTHDYAQILSNGTLRILMRRTDRIVSGGENINPVEIEEIIEQLNEVQEALITGIPDEEWGQKLVALIVLEKEINSDMLLSYLKSKLESFKIPKAFFYVNELPKISISKLNRIQAIEIAQKLSSQT